MSHKILNSLGAKIKLHVIGLVYCFICEKLLIFTFSVSKGAHLDKQ